MKKILILSPISITGKLIMESFASGFEMNKCRVLLKDAEGLTLEDAEYFMPDMVLGYDYSYLADENCKKIVEKIEEKQSNLSKVFFFADEPKGNYSLNGNESLYKELKKIDATVFVWDKKFVNDFKNAFHMPLAASPLKYSTEFSGYEYPITFVGEPLSEKRQRILCDLIKVFKGKLNVFCTEDSFLQSIEEIKSLDLLEDSDLTIYSNCWKGFLKSEQELARIYNSSKINLNITRQGSTSMNYRVFEILASGGFLVTDENEDLKRYFTVSKHLETYKNVPDLIDKIDFYLQNLNIAQKIAQLGRFKCIDRHNFGARAKSILGRTFAA